MPDRRLLPLLLAGALALSACGQDGAPMDAGMPDGAAAPDAGLPGEVGPSLPSEFIISTNEPFWQARVEGGGIVLVGPDVDGRRFSIDSEEDGDGARLVHGSDADGTISLTLLPGPCQDSMSGAEFPHAGELTIDGIGPTRGCARPADMPPPGEPGI